MPPLPAGSTIVCDATQTASILAPGGGAISEGAIVGSWSTPTNAVAGTQPFYTSKALMAGPGIVWGSYGADLSIPTSLSLASLAYSIPCTIAIAFRADGPTVLAGTTLCELSADVTANDGILISTSTGFSVTVRRAGNTQQADCGRGELCWADNAVRWVAIQIDGTSITIFENGVQVASAQSGTPPGAGPITQPMTLGAGHANTNPMVGSMGLFALWPRILSAADMAAVDAYVRAAWTLTTSQVQKFNALSIGDSIPGGGFLLVNRSAQLVYSYLSAKLFGNRFGVPYVLSYSGEDLAFIRSQIAGSLLPQLVTDRPNVIWFEGGLGTLNKANPQNGTQQAAAAATCISDYHGCISDIVAGVTALGSSFVSHILAHTITFEGSANAFWDGARATANADYLANVPGLGNGSCAVHMVDVGGDVLLGSAAGFTPPTNNVFVPVGEIHPAESGMWHWAAYDVAAMKAAGLV